MCRRISLLFSLCILTQVAFSQSIIPSDLIKEQKDQGATFDQIDFFQKSSTTNRSNNIPETVKEYQLLSLNPTTRNFLSTSSPKSLTLKIPTTFRSNIELELVEVNLGNFLVKEASTMSPIKYSPGKHYRGIIKGDEKSLVSISIFDDEIMGLISPSGQSANLVLGKIKDSQDHILYEDGDLVQELGFECGTEDSGVMYEDSELRGSSTSRALTDCVGMYFEVDNDIYQNKGGSTGATNYVTGLYNEIATLYANENINTNISEIVLWNTASPYNSSSSSGMLNAFMANTQGFNGDIAQLLSYKASGGIAWVNGLCSSNPDYSKSFASINSTYSLFPTYSWSVMVCTHEFGHLLGSQHTQACVWNGNGTAIDGCVSPEGSCPRPGIPSNGGTVMSYCHLTSAGINLNNGFGSQPGNVIRSRVTTANCLQECDGGNPPPPPPGCNDNLAVLSILTDNYPGETTWTIKDGSGATLYSGGPYSSRGTTYNIELCLPDGCYDFKINDSYGDGICCGYGTGAYQVTSSGSTLITGGQFGSTETKNFCLNGGGSGPTCTDGTQNGNETGIDCGGPDCPPCISCNDGIQNGNETGVDCGGPDCPACDSCNDGIQNGGETEVDCGGPDCPACPTCNDGIQNGNETGVDCGGPDCQACPTCNDGIQNGNETGVDCGGPNCAPCNPGGTSTLLAHYFETGWDGWQDGGSDCYRYLGTRSAEGNYCIRLRDNSGTSSTMTSPEYNLSSFSQIDVEFYFYAYSMETNEDFWMQVYDGSQWVTVIDLARGVDFNNSTFYVVNMTLYSSQVNFAQNAKFRFRCDASSNADQVYIDAITITGTEASALVEKGLEIKELAKNDFSEIEHVSSMNLFPNPASNTINLTFEDEEEIMNSKAIITIMDLTGRKMLTTSVDRAQEDNISIDVSQFSSGIYLLKAVTSDGEVEVKKFQVYR